jgi:hypothetical protein
MIFDLIDIVLFRYSWPIQQNQKLFLIYSFVIEKDLSIFLRRSIQIVCYFSKFFSIYLFIKISLGTDDEQFNDEKAYLIKQISELKDTKA